MASKNRKRLRAAKRVATATVATASVTALMVGTAPPPQASAASTQSSPGLPSMALAPGAPDPASIPDITFGLGPQAYNLFQNGGASLESALLNNVNLSGVLERLGIDPETAINNALGNLLVQALTNTAVPVDNIPVLGPILKSAKITNVAALLNLIGLNIADPLNTPGINVITTGPPFSLLKFLGVDIGWTPGFPNAVAQAINQSQYLGISPVEVLTTLKNSPGVTLVEKATLDTAIGIVSAAVGNGNAIDVRIPVVLAFGLGAFAAGQAYPQVVADLPNQPGGAATTGSPLAGSITILPMILLRNPGRANGGLFARFYPEAGLLGIDTVTPDTAVSSSVNPNNKLNIPVGTTGIVIGGANLIPIKVDATAEYDPLSDVPAWPNPVSLANTAAAALFPTYLLRGITAESLTQVVDGQLKPQAAAALANTSGPLALNFYLTVPVNGALPLMEPVKLPTDVINLFTGLNLNNPIATAFEPALTSLANLGYTDVKRNVVNGVPEYDRTFDQGNVITPFGTLPSGVDWGQVPVDVFLQLVAGFQKAISQGFISNTPVVNPLGIIANLLGLGALPGAANATSPVGDIVGLNALSAGAVNTATSTALPTAVQSQSPAPGAAKVSSSDPAANVQADNAIDSGAAADSASGGGTAPVIEAGGGTPSQGTSPVTGLQAGVNNTVKGFADDFGKIANDIGTGVQNTVNGLAGNKPADSTGDKTSDNAGDKAGDKAGSSSSS